MILTLIEFSRGPAPTVCGLFDAKLFNGTPIDRNYTIIDHGNDKFSILAHMQTNSVQAKTGDKVVKGELIGRIGNSGDSSSPHIHYQFQNGRDLRTSEGLPSKFQRFDLITGNTTRRIEGLCPNTGMIIKHE